MKLIKNRVARSLVAILALSLLTTFSSPTYSNAAAPTIPAPTINSYFSLINGIYFVSTDSSRILNGYSLAYSLDGGNYRLVGSTSSDFPEVTELVVNNNSWEVDISNLSVGEYLVQIAYAIVDPLTNEITGMSQSTEGVYLNVTDTVQDDSDLLATNLNISPKQHAATVSFHVPPAISAGVFFNAYYVYSVSGVGPEDYSDNFPSPILIPLNGQSTKTFTITGLNADVNYSFNLGLYVEGLGMVGSLSEIQSFTTLAAETPTNAGSLDTAFATEGSIYLDEIFDRHLNVERIETDSQDRIVVLASFVDGDYDNHILFRLNSNGSYDDSFGENILSGHNYFFITRTSISFNYERVDLQLESNDNALVMLSGAETPFASENFVYQNLIIRVTSDGERDLNFGTGGVVGDLSPQFGAPSSLLSDISLDADGGFLTAGIYSYPGESDPRLGLQIQTYSHNGNSVQGWEQLIETGQRLVTEFLPAVRVIKDDAGGYLITYSLISNYDAMPATGIVRLNNIGEVDTNFATQEDFGGDLNGQNYFFPVIAESNNLIQGGFVLTDLFPDGPDGFIVSGTAVPPMGNQFINLLFRLKTNGMIDTTFGDPGRFEGTNYIVTGYTGESICFNLALFKNTNVIDSSTAIIVSDLCGNLDHATLLAFNAAGIADERFGEAGVTALRPIGQSFSNVPVQLQETQNGKLLVLNGSRPTRGLFPIYIAIVNGFEIPEGTVSISRYLLSSSNSVNPRPTITPSSSSVTARVGTAITPVTLTLGGGTGAETATVTSGYALPAGLTLASSGSIATISGTPTAAGTTTISFTVTDSLNETATATVEFVISLATSRPSTTSPSRVSGTVGTALTPATLSLSGATSSETVTVTSGYVLPAGLSLATNGRVTGTPTAAGTTSTRLTFTNTQSETATATVEFVISLAAPAYVPPSPIAYVKALTTPQIHFTAGKLLCTPGTYNAGYTLDGVIMGSATALFSPASFTYSLLINGVKQASLQITTANKSVSWDLPASPSGTIFTCSVTVASNGATTTDNSSDNPGAATTRTAQSQAITTANTNYTNALAQNIKSYEKALVDNRTNWRSDMEKIQATYYAERDRVKALPASKQTSALRSAALKTYMAAQKKSAADYKASKPAALAAKDAANKAALDAKDTAIAKANSTYATLIESIGYGVQIP